MSEKINLLNYSLGKKLNEGKTKIIHEFIDCGGDVAEDVVAMVFKDDITAGDGVKHDVIEGKALLDWRTNKNIYEFLNAQGINTHYSYSPDKLMSVVSKLDQKINLEVVSRRIATGSILKHTEMFAEGEVIHPVLTQFYYKDDFLHDPLLDESFLIHLINNKNCSLFYELKQLNAKIFQVLEQAFAQFRVQLVDIKLEYGIVDGKITLIDEITGGSFRLWPYRDGINQIDLFDQDNVLPLLDPSGRLDKDNYRLGNKTLNEVYDKFRVIAEITDKFQGLIL